MNRKKTAIPVNNFGSKLESGILIEKLELKKLPRLEELEKSERHYSHSFFLIEKGSIDIEIDFHIYKVKSPSLIYIHPNQIHRIKAFDNLTAGMLLINDENLNSDYIKLLENITPAIPTKLDEQIFSLIFEAFSLCHRLAVLESNRLNHLLIRDSSNTLAGLVISQYMPPVKATANLSRYETISKKFRETLEQDFISLKSPSQYAGKLNISVPYLNESVRNATGYPVTYHIQQRVVLEAKRMLCHSAYSVKEIASDLGYDDYTYFSRLFKKITGVTPITFRKKTSISPILTS